MLLQEPSCDLIWTSRETGAFHFEKGTLLFSLFLVDPMKSKDEIRNELFTIHKALETRFEPWARYYVWDTTPVKTELVDDTARSVSYIYGELVFGDTFDDQWLVTSELFEFSRTYPDLYIHLSDNDGEFLLIEAYEGLPEWLTPENAANRDWINHGRVLIVPEEYYSGRGLRLNEALVFLEKAVYKCSQVMEVDEILKKKVDEYPQKALEGQCEIEIKISKAYAGLLMNSDRSLLNRAVMDHGKDSFGSEAGEDTINKDVDVELIALKLRTTLMCFLFIDFYLKSIENKHDFPTVAGKLVMKALKNHIKENEIDLQQSYPSEEEIERFNKQGDVLQKELIRLMRIEQFVSPKFDFNESQTKDNGEFNEEELTTRLKDFFEDNSAGIDGIENKPNNAGIQEIDDDKLEDDVDAEEEKAKEFLRQQNVHIDEDDFFEFFAKEALKLSDEDLEKFRSLGFDPEEPEKRAEYEAEENDFEEERELFENLSYNDVESFQNLLKVLKNTGSEGPGSTFLQNLGTL